MNKILKQSLKLYTNSPINVSLHILRYKGSFARLTVKHKWDLLSSVCIERHPLCSTPKTELQEAYQKMLHEIECEKSMKSNHELRVEVDVKQRELLKKGVLEINVKNAALQNAEDLEETGQQELAEFQFAPKITETDRNNITTSLERKLDKSLLLLVHQKIGNDAFWLPPLGIRKKNETMRETADRVLHDICGDQLVAKIYGNAPIGFYKWVYPKSIRNRGTRGAKVFFYLAKHMNGSVPNAVKHQWLDRPECEEHVPPPIFKSVSQFLISQ